MEFEWDEEKRLKNVEKHGMDFRDARVIFDGRAVYTAPSTYEDEERFKTVGLLDGKPWTVIWTWRYEKIRFISVRRARNAEDRAYRDAHGGRD